MARRNTPAPLPWMKMSFCPIAEDFQLILQDVAGSESCGGVEQRIGMKVDDDGIVQSTVALIRRMLGIALALVVGVATLERLPAVVIDIIGGWRRLIHLLLQLPRINHQRASDAVILHDGIKQHWHLEEGRILEGVNLVELQRFQTELHAHGVLDQERAPSVSNCCPR